MKDPTFVPQTRQEQENWPRVAYTANSQITRTDVVKHLHTYVKENNLKNENSNEFKPDSLLKKLLGNQDTYNTST
jgi:hypothetical protein